MTNVATTGYIAMHPSAVVVDRAAEAGGALLPRRGEAGRAAAAFSPPRLAMGRARFPRGARRRPPRRRVGKSRAARLSPARPSQHYDACHAVHSRAPLANSRIER